MAVAAAQAVEFVGLPEARINLAQAMIHLALAPKSNAVIKAIGAASADVRAGLAGPVPAHLRDAHYPGADRLGHGQGYVYPHDYAEGVVAQQYAPDALAGRTLLPAVPARRGGALRGALRADQGDPGPRRPNPASRARTSGAQASPAQAGPAEDEPGQDGS